MKRNTRVGLVTSGGDCQGLNAAIRGVGKALFQYVDNVEIYGMYDGYKGLIEGDYKFMEPSDFSGILIEGGTILGTSRQKYIPGKAIVDDEGNDLMPAMLNTYNRLNLDCLVVMGGNGTQKSAKLLMDAGMNIVTLPKTIDNDIWGTDTTFGFQSAVDIATNVIDYIHSTASSHSRVFLVELMGRDAGWLTASCALALVEPDVVLLPEVPLNEDALMERLGSLLAEKNTVMVGVSEGVRDAIKRAEQQLLPPRPAAGGAQALPPGPALIAVGGAHPAPAGGQLLQNVRAPAAQQLVHPLRPGAGGGVEGAQRDGYHKFHTKPSQSVPKAGIL